MKELIKSESGVFLIVEAAIIYPIMLVMIMTLLFISMMLTMKANMQSALETALMYYRTELTDSYIGFGDLAGNDVRNTQYTNAEAPEASGSFTNIYAECIEELAAKPDKAKFEQMFFNNYRFLNFSSGEEGSVFHNTRIEIDFQSTANFIIYRELKATATQTIKLPFIKGFFGLDNSIKLKADARIVVSDSVSVMRITDVVDYFMIKTGLDQKIDSIFGSSVDKFLNFIKG
ncbi:MAG: TadE/TadG family type IV pilus assembly protein [Huintestinicola sp.]|uniref:TadE/TadG family type IV pilus assembly protein n=1 Tax=Huintestinicola sp. TaxID=2981661 RepID=UPI003EFD0C3E